MQRSTPTPPFAEIGLFFWKLDDAQAFRCVLEALIKCGGSLGGDATIHVGDDASQPFRSSTDFLQAPRFVHSLDDVDELDLAAECRLVSVEMQDVHLGPRDELAVVTFGSTSEPVAAGHPVQIWFSGDAINLAMVRGRSSREARALVSLFKEIVKATTPSYAAISFDRPLATPASFKDPATKHDYPDFFLAEQFTGSERLADIRQALGAQVETVEAGVIVLSSPIFGAHKGSDATAAAEQLRDHVLSAALRNPGAAGC